MLRSLMANPLFEESDVFVFADGPKENATAEEIEKINRVRKLFAPFTERKNVSLRFSAKNLGLTSSIVSAISEIVNQFGRVIVIEDDIELSPGFLKYMNEALNLYENEARVMHVGGYMVPHNKKLPETFFLKAPTIWGWGTWKRAWDNFEINATQILNDLEIKFGEKFAYDLDVNGTYSYTKQLKDISTGKLDTWDIQWASSIYLNEGLCLHPNISLSRNNGFDGSGVHCYPSEFYDNQKITTSVSVNKEELKISKAGEITLMNFHILKNKTTLSEKLMGIYYKIAAAFPRSMRTEAKSIYKKLRSA